MNILDFREVVKSEMVTLGLDVDDSKVLLGVYRIAEAAIMYSNGSIDDVLEELRRGIMVKSGRL